MKTIKESVQTVYGALKEQFGYTNVMQAPRVSKVIVSVGTGKIQDKQRIELIANRLSRITGQKIIGRPARKSIASFKVRQGDTIGYQVTLRGARMYDFLDKLVHVALPQTRDFRGLPVSAIDDMGNYTIGIKEHTIFPETADEELRDVFGFAITLVTSAKTKEEAEAFLRHIGVPLRASVIEEKKVRKIVKKRK